MPAHPPPLDLSAGRTRRVCATLILISLLLGSGIRLTKFLLRPSYWNDEAAVVVNVMRRDCRQLVQPLDYAQAAPPLFLWVERGSYRLLGASEWSMRAFPFALGLIGMGLVAAVAWRRLPPTSAVWAVALLAFSDKAINTCNEVKQYSADVAVCAGILLAATVACHRRRHLLVCAVGAVGLWLSFPSAFVVGAILLGSIRLIRRDPVVYLAGVAMVLASFALLYVVCIGQGHDASLDTFWREAFPDWHRPLRWLAGQLYGVVDYPIPSFGWLTGIFIVLGFIALAKQKRWQTASLLPLTLVFALVAAALHRYPFPSDNRLSLYLLPMLLLTLAAAAEPQDLELRGGLLKWYWLLFMPLLGISIALAGKHLVLPDESSQTRQVVHYVKGHRKPEEPLVLVGDMLDASIAPSGRNVELLCYWPTPPGRVIDRIVPVETVGADRFWVVYSLRRPRVGAATFADEVSRAMGGARIVDSYEYREQAGALLLERSPARQPSTAAVRQ